MGRAKRLVSSGWPRAQKKEFGSGAFLKVKQLEYCEVKKMPGGVLADLWRARFGTDWVPHDSLLQDAMFTAVVQRLLNEHRMERQTTTNKMQTLYRLIEVEE